MSIDASAQAVDTQVETHAFQADVRQVLERHPVVDALVQQQLFSRDAAIDGVRDVNDAFGYPQETSTATQHLLCVAEI